MAKTEEGDSVIAQLETLKSRLDESLNGLRDRVEHIPMHEIVHGLISLVAAQHAEIEKLKLELAESRARASRH